jgi:hypothetical protein
MYNKLKKASIKLRKKLIIFIKKQKINYTNKGLRNKNQRKS